MEKRFLLLVGMICLLLSLNACGGNGGSNSDSPTNPTLSTKVSPTDLSLLSDKGATCSFNITSNESWTLRNNAPEWLYVSATNGEGNSQITLSALSSNTSSTERTAHIAVMTENNGLVSTITVTQLAGLMSGCNVEIGDVLVLGQSAAFSFYPQKNVDFFRFGYLNAEAVGWTDEKIIKELEELDPYSPTEITGGGIENLTSNTSYLLCTVGYDSKGNRGEVYRLKITTPKMSQSDPWAYISGFDYDSNYWYYTTTPDGFTSSYYKVYVEGIDALYFYYLYVPAEIAKIIKNLINEGSISPLVREQSWKAQRSQDSEYFYCATWGLNLSNEFSPQMNIAVFTTGNSRSTESTLMMKNQVKDGEIILKTHTFEEMNRITDIITNNIRLK